MKTVAHTLARLVRPWAWQPVVRRGTFTTGCWALVTVAWSAIAWAQDAQREFVPAETVAKQEIPSAPLLYGAYAFVWAALILYVFLLWRRIARVERELGEVNRKLSGQ